MLKDWNWFARILGVLVASGAVMHPGSGSVAQNITFDRTLSPNPRTLLGPIYSIRQADGRVTANNLFHSFSRFSLAAGEAASFESDGSIQRIIARVTGDFPSLINGPLLTQSFAVDLYFINPNGIVFGPGARLNVGGPLQGAFVATTVDTLVWPNGGRFSASNPRSANSVLTLVGDPSGFLSTLPTTQPIFSVGSLLSMYPGQSLILLGGDLGLENTFLSVGDFRTLIGNGGRIELGGIQGPGQVGLTRQGDLLRLQFPSAVTRSNVSLVRSRVEVIAANGGDLTIHANNLDILEESVILAGLLRGFDSPDNRAGNVVLNVSNRTQLGQSSDINNNIYPGAMGRGGVIRINTGSLFVRGGSVLFAHLLGEGSGSDIIINARDRVVFEGENRDGAVSAASTLVELSGIGEGGQIRIHGGSVFLRNGAQLRSSLNGQGRSGDITIRASGRVQLSGQTNRGAGGGILTDVSFIGTGGRIAIAADSILIQDGNQLFADLFGVGTAGDIILRAQNDIVIEGEDSVFPTSIGSSVSDDAIGDAGDIRLSAGRSLFLRNGAFLRGRSEGLGNAGDIVIQAGEEVVFEGLTSRGRPVVIATSIEKEGVGTGGNIVITSGNLTVRNGAFLSTSILGEGDAGDIRITVTDSVTFEGGGPPERNSAAYSAIGYGGEGAGGNIVIRAGHSLVLRDGSQMTTATFGDGNAGNVIIETGERIVFENFAPDGFGSQILSSADTEAVGNAGSIRLSTPLLQMSDKGIVDVSSLSGGRAGEIRVDARRIEMRESNFTSITDSGDGGNIRLDNVEFLFLDRTSRISTAAGVAQEGTPGGGPRGGNGGNITIDVADGFVVATPLENNDITSNAFEGSGGRIEITAQGIYGLTPRTREELQNLLGTTDPEALNPELLPTSDVTAFSQTSAALNGTIAFTTPDVDPSRGIAELPSTVIDASNLVAQGCGAEGRASEELGEFLVTGRGGLPPQPDEPLTPGSILSPWVDVPHANGDGSDRPLPVSTHQAPITEAQAWRMGPTGEVILIAEASGAVPSTIPASCQL